MIKLVFGAPAYHRDADVDQFVMGLHIGQALNDYKDEIEYVGFIKTDTCCVDYARDKLMFDAHRAGANWLVMYDADTVELNAKRVLEMVIKGDEVGAAMIGAPIEMRNGKGFNVVSNDDYDHFAGPAEFLNKVIEVRRIGTGLVAINLDWVMKNLGHSPWFETLRVRGPAPNKVGSDMTFSEKIWEAGGKVFCDGRFIPTHIGLGGTGHPEADRPAWIRRLWLENSDMDSDFWHKLLGRYCGSNGKSNLQPDRPDA